jgi:predicted amidophosphoribosyltransferase
LVVYEGPGRALVTRFKYGNARDALPWLAGAMASLVDAEAIDVVTWLPTTSARRRRRGFDQAELLAGHVAAELRRPFRRLLDRRPGPSQTGGSRADRRHRPVFVLRPAVGIGPGLRALLVDDVLTTGATFSAAADVLRPAGVDELRGLVIARTPAHPERGGSGAGRDRAEPRTVRPDPIESSTIS